ncbi:hypothetical protein BDU57DRAFT_573024 [Ampelomyces quisqualis]|uniref:Uncharacterized protein n=1 Tax=Ampelomyces quisqualis TaxID=50730 RepID=A0A6A5QNZ3_AMPQU|nr:hypothetical protein BDU57DRAFT_573024 [Ampelomyces quisqualis]
MRFFLFTFSALQVHLSIYFVTRLFCWSVAAEPTDLADFDQTIPILGQMARTDQDFKDGLALDLFSPQNRTLVVSKNTSPLPGKFVSGSTGETFVALSNYSWIIKVNDTARDLIAKVELPYEPEDVQNRGFNVADTSENKTRIIKMTSLDGEYILLGRNSIDTANIFVQYGFGATRTVNLTGGGGMQEAEFVDGLRISLESDQDMGINIDLSNGVDGIAVPTGMRSLTLLFSSNAHGLDSYAWAMNTSASNQQLKRGTIRFPINTSLVSSSGNDTTSVKKTQIMVAKRALDATSSTPFIPLSQKSHKVECRPDCSVTVKDLQQLDGHYITALKNWLMNSPEWSAGPS